MAYIGEMQYLTIGNNTYSLPTGGGGGGTVTSVGVANATNGGLSVSGSPITSNGTITIGHSNILSSAQTTQAVYPIKIDKNGHISSYGSAVTIPTKVSQLTNDSNYVTTDEKVKQTPLNAVNGYRQMIVTTSSLSSETTSTTAFTKNLTYNDYTPTLKIEKNSDSTKYISITGEVIKVNNGSYAIKIICDTPTTSDKTITFPNATGTVALTSDIPTKTSDLTNDGDGTSAFATLADIGSFGGGTVTSVGVTNATNGGLSISGSPVTTSGTITIGHSNVLSSAQTTQAVYPIKIDKNGHISAYGNAVTIPTKTSDLTNDSGFITSYTDEKLNVTSISNNTEYTLVTMPSSGSTPRTATGNLCHEFKIKIDGSTYSALYVGGSYRGQIKLGNTTNSSITYTTLKTSHTTDRTITLPNKDGTVALTSDIPTVPTITLNGSTTTSPSFYAPTSAGTDGYVLKSNGSGAPTWDAISTTDTKNTAGSTNSTSKLYLIGATEQSANPQTYSSVNLTVTNGAITANGDLTLGLRNNNQSKLILKYSDSVYTTIYTSGSNGNVSTLLFGNPTTSSANTGNVRLRGIDGPSTNYDAANKKYVDDSIPSITLNGSGSTTPSFYAPISAGTNGQYLKSTGSGAPSWTNFPTIPSITLNGSSTTSPSFYAPTSAGTSGYYLKSTGNGAPTWSAKPSYVASEIEVGEGTFSDYTIDVALDDIDSDIKTNYLPLTAGSTKALSGDLYLPNNNIRFGNSKIIMGYTTGLDTDIYLNAFQACNENNNLVIGYGGYNNEIGKTNIYGNDINMFCNNTIRFDKSIAFMNHSSVMGTIINSYLSSSKSCASGSWVALCNVTVPAGTWIGQYGVRWPSSGSGIRQANVSSTSGNNTQHICVSPSGTSTSTQIRWSEIFTLSEDTTLYLNAYHNHGSALTLPASGSGYGSYMRFIRIL